MSIQSSLNFDPELARVSSRIGREVLAYCREHRSFHAEDLRQHVAAIGIAPGSADRILRDLRQRGAVRYSVVSRRESLYRVDWVEA